MKKVSIFASLLVLLLNNVAAANEIKKESSLNNTVYTQVENIENYLTKKAKRFLKANSQDWETYRKTVETFNTSNGKFQMLSENEKSNFILAANRIEKELSSKRKGAQWSKNVESTKVIYQFIWDSKKTPENQILVAPAKRTLGR